MLSSQFRAWFFVVLLALSACEKDSLEERRSVGVQANMETLNIALAWPFDQATSGTKTTIREGIELAIREVNDSGGLLGRRIELHLFDDQRNINVGLKNAQSIVQREDLFAVIGHLDSYISIPAAPTYERSGLLVLNPGSTAAELTLQNNQHLFRTLSTNNEQGRQLARHLKSVGKRRIVIYYVNNDFGIATANSFENEAIRQDLTIVDRRSYAKFSRDHTRTMEDWKNYYEFDAFFLAGSMPEGIDIVKSVREAGIDVDIYAGAGLDSLEFVRNGGAAVNGVRVITFFHPEINWPSVQDYVSAYRNEYKVDPIEASSALGYDTIKLLAASIADAGTLDRTAVANSMRGITGWEGATGRYEFDENGDVVNKMLVLTTIRDGKYTEPVIIQ